MYAYGCGQQILSGAASASCLVLCHNISILAEKLLPLSPQAHNPWLHPWYALAHGYNYVCIPSCCLHVQAHIIMLYLHVIYKNTIVSYHVWVLELGQDCRLLQIANLVILRVCSLPQVDIVSSVLVLPHCLCGPTGSFLKPEDDDTNILTFKPFLLGVKINNNGIFSTDNLSIQHYR